MVGVGTNAGTKSEKIAMGIVTCKEVGRSEGYTRWRFAVRVPGKAFPLNGEIIKVWRAIRSDIDIVVSRFSGDSIVDISLPNEISPSERSIFAMRIEPWLVDPV